MAIFSLSPFALVGLWSNSCEVMRSPEKKVDEFGRSGAQKTMNPTCLPYNSAHEAHMFSALCPSLPPKVNTLGRERETDSRSCSRHELISFMQCLKYPSF